MSGWRDPILRHFTPEIASAARLTLVSDPDELLGEPGVVEGIRDQGFEIIAFNDHVRFRYEYEQRFRRFWDGGETTTLVVVLRAGQQDLHALPYDLLEEAKEIVQNQVPGSIMELNFENMPVASDELIIRGNKNLLLIALENLIENANKFSENRKVNINLLNEPDRVVITIKDCGIGIPEKDLRNVMQTFYRADNARSYSGSGIGLPLSYKILQLHKAKLEIQSKDGIGTTVSVIFSKI